MIRARLLTIGTEITSGEVVNTNAAWVSKQLEDLGARVRSHLTVTDQRAEILAALAADSECAITVVTGGLGPTSDDITRECVAEHLGLTLEFDTKVHADLAALYKARGLPLREAHKQQCFFPAGCERLKNPTGTALGFYVQSADKHFFVLPGPPRELEGMWNLEAVPRLTKLIPPSRYKWVRWTCLGLPESEVAELVEPVIAGTGLEVGYRAQVPYVKVKAYAAAEHSAVVKRIGEVLGAAVVARDFTDLAEELLINWPLPSLSLADSVCDDNLALRLFEAQRALRAKNAPFPHLNVQLGQTGPFESGIQVTAQGDDFIIAMRAGSKLVNERKTIPYKFSLATERGKRAAAEWVIWICLKALKN